MKAGATNGERGYQLTFAIAYIRDFMMAHDILAESFETTVAWSREVCILSITAGGRSRASRFTAQRARVRDKESGIATFLVQWGLYRQPIEPVNS